MNSRALLAFAAFSFVAASGAFAEGKLVDADARALKKLAEANQSEIRAGKLAADKAKSAEVKQFGQRMVTDHGKMLDALKKLAEAKGVSLPGSPAMGDRASLMKLRTMSGDNFDHDYMAEMVKDHEKDVKETAELAKGAQDPQLKQAIEQAHAKIQEHLQLAQQIASRTAASGGTSKK